MGKFVFSHFFLYICYMDKITSEEEKFIDKINENFNYFIKAIPFVEINDDISGTTHKLRCSIDVGTEEYSIAEILFELQWLLHRAKERTERNILKLIVSNLILTPEIPNSTFRRGLIIKMKYERE